LPAILGETDICNSITAVEGDSSRCYAPASLDFFAVGQAGDKRTDVVSPDWPCLCRSCPWLDARAVVVWNSISRIHPEVGTWLSFDGDFVDVLDPIRSIVARDNQPQRKSIQHRERIAIHFVGKERVFVQRVIHFERFDKIRRFFQWSFI